MTQSPPLPIQKIQLPPELPLKHQLTKTRIAACSKFALVNKSIGKPYFSNLIWPLITHSRFSNLAVLT